MNLQSEPGQRHGLRILVVEDHPDVCRTLKALLQAMGHEPVFASDMQSALMSAEESGFELLLSDIGLPDGDGWQLVRRLRLAGHCPPLTVAMSCLNSPADLAQSEAAGYNAHLCKPFTADELESVLSPAAHRG